MKQASKRKATSIFSASVRRSLRQNGWNGGMLSGAKCFNFSFTNFISYEDIDYKDKSKWAECVVLILWWKVKVLSRELSV